MFPTSIYENVYENFERLHLNVAGLVLYTTWGMVDLWFHQCATAITHVGPDSRKMAPRLQLGYKWCHSTLFKVLAPYGLVSIPHPLIKGVWDHSYAVDGQMDLSFWKLTEFLVQRWFTINDVMVHWLRPKTHMEWFPFHIHSKHIKYVWDHSYAVDGQMDPPMCHHCQQHVGLILGSQMMSWYIG